MDPFSATDHNQVFVFAVHFSSHSDRANETPQEELLLVHQNKSQKRLLSKYGNDSLCSQKLPTTS